MEGHQRRTKGHLASLVSKRTVKIGGRRSSISVEDAFWNALKHIAAGEGLPVYELVSRIDLKRDLDRDNSNLSSAIRVFILEHYRELAETKR